MIDPFLHTGIFVVPWFLVRVFLQKQHKLFQGMITKKEDKP